MNIYHLSQNICNGYETYSDCIVAAETNKKAKEIHPSTYAKGKWWDGNHYLGSWVKPKYVIAEFIGKAKKGTKSGLICASFNAG